MAGFQQLGNDLYTGKRSIDFVGRRRIWFLIALIGIAISVIAPIVRGGYSLGIEFTGGSEFVVSGAGTADTAPATSVTANHSSTPARVTSLGDGSIRVQTDPLDEGNIAQLRDELAGAYGVEQSQVAVSTIGPSWGSDITRQMGIGLIVFVVLAGALMWAYFRTWKMSAAAFLALLHDLVVTTGVYAVTGIEITPAAVIGFLTVLGYSLYDSVVVFDKIRENTEGHVQDGSRTFGELVNLAVNQTLVRSINTSVVALLPVAAILVIGVGVLGAGTLRDISLALFIGIIVGALSTIFLAGPLYVALRSGEDRVRRIDQRILARRSGKTLPPLEEDEPERRPARREADESPIERERELGDEEPWELAGADEDAAADDAYLDEADPAEDDAPDPAAGPEPEKASVRAGGGSRQRSQPKRKKRRR